MEPIYKKAQEYDVPIILHDMDIIAPPYSIKYTSDRNSIDEVLLNHPDIQFILAPYEYGMSFSGPLLRHPKNTSGDISTLIYALEKDFPDMLITQQLTIAAKMYGSHRILLGSNWPFQNVPLKTWVQKVKKIKSAIIRLVGFPSMTKEDRSNILFKNITRLLKI